MRKQQEAEYIEYVTARLEPMRYFAYLSCGDWQRAEDAVQTAFEKLYVAWNRPSRAALDAYTRRIIVRTLINERRRGWFRRERPSQALPETAVAASDPADRLSLVEALGRLTVRQRTTVVLRFWEDLPVEQTAQIMNCSASTVKSQTARALARLRELLNDTTPELAEGGTR